MSPSELSLFRDLEELLTVGVSVTAASDEERLCVCMCVLACHVCVCSHLFLNHVFCPPEPFLPLSPPPPPLVPPDPADIDPDSPSVLGQSDSRREERQNKTKWV